MRLSGQHSQAHLRDAARSDLMWSGLVWSLRRSGADLHVSVGERYQYSILLSVAGSCISVEICECFKFYDYMAAPTINPFVPSPLLSPLPSPLSRFLTLSRPPAPPLPPRPDASSGRNAGPDATGGRHDDPRRYAFRRLDPGTDPLGDDDAEPLHGAGGSRGRRGCGADDPRAGAADAVGKGAGREEQAAHGRGPGRDVPARRVRGRGGGVVGGGGGLDDGCVDIA